MFWWNLDLLLLGEHILKTINVHFCWKEVYAPAKFRSFRKMSFLKIFKISHFGHFLETLKFCRSLHIFSETSIIYGFRNLFKIRLKVSGPNFTKKYWKRIILDRKVQGPGGHMLPPGEYYCDKDGKCPDMTMKAYNNNINFFLSTLTEFSFLLVDRWSGM